MLCQVASGMHGWDDEISAVPTHSRAKPQPGERAWDNQLGRATLLTPLLCTSTSCVRWTPPRTDRSKLHGSLELAHPMRSRPATARSYLMPSQAMRRSYMQRPCTRNILRLGKLPSLTLNLALALHVACRLRFGTGLLSEFRRLVCASRVIEQHPVSFHDASEKRAAPRASVGDGRPESAV